MIKKNKNFINFNRFWYSILLYKKVIKFKFAGHSVEGILHIMKGNVGENTELKK